MNSKDQQPVHHFFLFTCVHETLGLVGIRIQVLLVCRQTQPAWNLGDLMSSTWHKLAKGCTYTGVGRNYRSCGLDLFQLWVQERPMSSQEQSSTTLAYSQACPGHFLCTYPAQHTSAAPTPFECSLDCEMLIPSQLPLNIAFHKGPLRIRWLLWETLNRCRDNVDPWSTCAGVFWA